MDILFTKDGQKFSYRIAGLAIKDGRLLVQRADGDDGLALPGGHVAFGETSAETLSQEFREELGLEITIGELAAVGEVFWDWNGPCQQIGLYYWVGLKAGPWEGARPSAEKSEIEFLWVPVTDAASGRIKVYPEELMERLPAPGRVLHFTSHQTEK